MIKPTRQGFVYFRFPKESLPNTYFVQEYSGGHAISIVNNRKKRLDAASHLSEDQLCAIRDKFNRKEFDPFDYAKETNISRKAVLFK